MSSFDLQAADWDKEPRRLLLSQKVAAAIRKEIPLTKNFRACEYGCGTGLLSFCLKDDIGEILLADNSSGMLEVLNQKIKDHAVDNMKTLMLDLSTHDGPDAAFDLVYLQMALHHIPDSRDVLLKFRRMLKPGGFLAIADLDSEDGSFHHGVFTGHKGFDRLALSMLLKECGFDAVKIEDLCQFTKLNARDVEQTYSIFFACGRAV